MNITKRMIKIVSMVVLMVALCMVMGNFAYAAGTDYLDPTTVTTENANGKVIETTQNITSTVIGVIQIVGITFAVAMLIFVAIKYLTSAAEGKAEIKKYAIAYVVGAFLLFGATGILQIFKGFAGEATGSTGT